jgi:hypothetical protein
VGGGIGGQTYMGEIVVWNVGTAPCQLAGTPTLQSYDADGSVDTAASGLTAPPFAATLPASMPAFQDAVSNANRYLDVTVSGPMWDATGACPAGRIAPSTFVLAIGSVVLRVANKDADAVQNQSLQGCGGEIDLGPISVPSR